MATLQATAPRIGDQVSFPFGDPAAGITLEGEVRRISGAHGSQAGPAAWVQVAGFPAWLHEVPLAQLKPCSAPRFAWAQAAAAVRRAMGARA